MKIAHLAPLWLPVAADSSGGIETFLAELITAQVAQGHDVTLVASADSSVDAEVVGAVDEALVPVMQRGEAADYAYYEQEAIAAALPVAREADIVHSHVVPGGFALDTALGGAPPVLHTLHGQVTEDLCWALHRRRRGLVTVSESQADAVRAGGAEVFGWCHNGIDMSRIPASTEAGDDLLFLGRMEPQKGPDLAIAAAVAAGRSLRLAGPITDRAFFDQAIRPALSDRVTYVGVLDRRAKFEALAESACLLVTSRWSEPFGMVSIEAMATGTPVVALASGALPEVVDHGVTGCVVDDASGLPAAIRAAASLDRGTVRSAGAARFDVAVVATRYVGLYEQLVEDRQREQA